MASADPMLAAALADLDRDNDWDTDEQREIAHNAAIIGYTAAHATLTAALARRTEEVETLRVMVRDAYNEGYDTAIFLGVCEPANSGDAAAQHEWKQSSAYAGLAALAAPEDR